MCFTGPQWPDEYGLAELAARSGVAPRTIRFYQSQGLLPKPRRHGTRRPSTTDRHQERLRLVAELQDRGLTLGAIRDLVAREGRRRSPSPTGWASTQTLTWPLVRRHRPRLLDVAELTAMLRDRGPGLLGARAGRLRRSDSPPARRIWSQVRPCSTWRCASTTRASTSSCSGLARDLLRRRLAKCADDLVDLFTTRAGTGFGGRATPDDVETALDTLRPVARDTAGLIFAQEIERALHRLVDAGPAAVVKRRR